MLKYIQQESLYLVIDLQAQSEQSIYCRKYINIDIEVKGNTYLLRYIIKHLILMEKVNKNNNLGQFNNYQRICNLNIGCIYLK
ncbi:hypothetical protein pb186bvf_002095 [Paramecium bursaria]